MYPSLPKIHPQMQQFLTLFVLFAAGKFFANIYPSWTVFVIVLLFAAAIEHACLYCIRRNLNYFSFSSLSTSIGILLMMSVSAWWIYLLAVLFSIIQKYLFSVRGRHFFNPSNFGLIIMMCLFYSQSHIVLGQLGDDIWLRAAVVILSIMILTKVDRWIIPISFILSYLALEYFFVVGYDPVLTFEVVYERLYAVSFVVFVVFMLTDPRTTPEPLWQQAIFALFVAAVAVYLDRIDGFRAQHLFMSLFILSPWVPALKDRAVLKWSFVVFLLALGAVIYIENQPPYYFEMEG